MWIFEHLLIWNILFVNYKNINRHNINNDAMQQSPCICGPLVGPGPPVTHNKDVSWCYLSVNQKLPSRCPSRSSPCVVWLLPPWWCSDWLQRTHTHTLPQLPLSTSGHSELELLWTVQVCERWCSSSSHFSWVFVQTADCVLMLLLAGVQKENELTSGQLLLSCNVCVTSTALMVDQSFVLLWLIGLTHRNLLCLFVC